MRCFELYGTVGATVCCLDSLNYLLADKDLELTLRNVHNYLDPDGLFIFDVNTPYKFENVYGNNQYIFEDQNSYGEATYCGWQNEYDKESKLCNFYLSVFTEQENGSYTRADEVQTERCYDLDELRTYLKKCGFEFIGCYGGYDFSKPEENCERWYIIAKAKK